MRVSPDVLEDLDAYATNRGREVFVREALVAIREQHGHDGIRYGHVMVLLMAIDDGHVPPTKWLSFLPPEGTPDPVFKSMQAACGTAHHQVIGAMAERLKAPALKTGEGATLP